MSMNIVDIVLGLILLLGAVNGFRRGLLVEVTGLIGLILGVYGAIHFSYFLGDFMKERVNWDESSIQMFAFTGTFLIILVATVALGRVMTKVVDTLALGFFNKILGAIFGFLKVALILSVLLLIYHEVNSTVHIMKKERVKNSVLYEPVKNICPTIFPKLVKVIEE